MLTTSRAPPGTLVDDRFDRAEAMADQNEAAIALLPQKFQSRVEIRQAVLKNFVSRSAEFGQIARAGNPVVAAGIDDKAMKATLRKLLPENRQRRQIEIHRDAVHEQQRKIGVLEFAMRTIIRAVSRCRRF